MAKAKIRATAEIAKKFVEVTPGRAGYYEAGVRSPKNDWEQNAAAAAASYKGAVSAADIDRRFKGGIKRAGTAKWQKKAIELGVSRFGPGVAASEGDFIQGFDPYNAVIGAVDLPERKPRGDPGNYARTQAIGTALFKKRLALIGAGA